MKLLRVLIILAAAAACYFILTNSGSITSILVNMISDSVTETTRDESDSVPVSGNDYARPTASALPGSSNVPAPTDRGPLETDNPGAFDEIAGNHETPQNHIDIVNDAFGPDVVQIRNTDFEISAALREKIETLIGGYGRKFAFYAVTLDETMSFGYNPDEIFHTASTIKAPYVLYCCKQIAEGIVGLDETKVYESRFHHNGSGVLKDKPFGEVYTVEELLYYAIHYSDNVAYYMLLDHFGKDGYNEMLKGLGCKNLYLVNGRNWSETSPRDFIIIWRSIYEFYGQCEAGRMYFDLLLNARHNLIKDALPEYQSAHKSGWSEIGYHDTGIVFSEIPYYIAVMTNSPGSASDQAFVSKLIRAVDDVMKEYGDYCK